MLRSIILGIILSAILISSSCKKTSPTKPRLIFKFVFDSTQVRLGPTGQPDPLPAGHAGQNPLMSFMSAHYIEMAQTDTTALGRGLILYQTPNTTAGGSSAIDFSQEPFTKNNGTVYSVELDSVTPGTYKWLRVSLAYEKFGVQLYYDTTMTYSGIPVTINQSFPCTVSSFVGVNTYITSYVVDSSTISVNGNKAQGYWGFESKGIYNFQYGGTSYPYPYDFLESGQAAPGATTVVNPLFATSPIPAGSCVATGQFSDAAGNLVITGNETNDIVVTISLSTNKSFEWVEVGTPDGKWQPSIGENIVNMGVRGIIPYVQY